MVVFIFLPLLIFNLSLATQGFSFDNNKIFFAGDSSATFCRRSITAPDSYFDSLFSRLQASPPPGFSIEPSRDIPSWQPCKSIRSDLSGYGSLKIVDWNTECTDCSGSGVCSWSCLDCPQSAYEINIPTGFLGNEPDWCCCASRRSCIDQSDAPYVILNLLNNDLIQLFKFYDSDVDKVVEEAMLLTNYITAQGRKVIWLTSYPIGYGNLGNGESPCFNALSCIFSVNSNAEYFYEQFLPWAANQSNVYLIDFFEYINETYVPNPISFINAYGYDGIHLKPSGHQLYYDFMYPQLVTILDQ